MAMHRGTPSVDGRDFLQDVEHARQAPGPAADGTPFAVLPLRIHAVRRDRPAEAGLPTVRMVRLEITIINGGRSVAPVDEGLKFPATCLAATQGRIGLGRALHGPLLGDPGRGGEDRGVFGRGVVAAEIEADKDRRRTLGRVRHVEQHIERGPFLADRPDLELRARGLATEGVLRFLADLDHGIGLQLRRIRRAAEHVLLDESEDLRTTDLIPGLRVRHLASIGTHERIGQRIRRDLGLVGNRRRHRGQQEQG